ncbi:Exostosin-1 [Seminavis robusta]|uniref:Exostosin-1 n=1 Tax=Seminavis robusta TaxID=568900 RepID=A0A9N8EJJ8_9STRA|nr:Exostosin-1 [Seminavis robusta]|eukprot:Sro1035_g233940.1 Exostosin-1 (516) ;mRNA; r:29979-31526
MPRIPGKSKRSSTATTARSLSSSPSSSRWFVLMTAIGSFIVGRTMQVQWTQSERFQSVMTHVKPPQEQQQQQQEIISNDVIVSGTSGAAVVRSTNRKRNHHKKPHLMEDAPFRINDRTLRLSPHVDHLWLHNGNYMPELPQDEKPKTKLVLTDFGWNHPDPTVGRTFVRSLRMRELMQAVINHPYFDPTFRWTDMENGVYQPHGNLQYYVFMDVETCFESNYPYYKGDFKPNFDSDGSRKYTSQYESPCYDILQCDAIPRILKSPLFRNVPTARVFFFDCRGHGPNEGFRTTQASTQLSIVSISSGTKQLHPHSDMGQPPPPINPSRLSHRKRQEILDETACDPQQQNNNNGRPYFLTCIASTRNVLRYDLFGLHNATAGIVLLDKKQFQKLRPKTTYKKLLQQSVFSATPRGDNKFSYRFTEVLSAGAIPVVHSDDWVLPFRREFIDWPQECAIIIPEAKVNQTVDILRAISAEDTCRRRRRCYEIYTQYMANPEGNIDGILESAEAMAATTNA